MSKGYSTNQERLAEISRMGKVLSKRAGFRCEWCGSKDELRVWDYMPDFEPAIENLALLCGRCRELATGATAVPDELYNLRNALWSDIPAVSEGVAVVLVRSRLPWVREAIEESLIADDAKARILACIQK